ncbi:hypothetical protein CANINC_001097 [Pichia inconspicua]|uniref:Uncharacterized protein n=1 Tax=Pichia inconspicua TaxID=52247 RepID=A0A4V4NG22_9ASCO|nr:hypothetical protein CANINC_001097 [[Candida] inconspicua]
MNYADAITAGDNISILTAKKRILSDADPENKYHLIYELSSTEPLPVHEIVSEILTTFATKILPNAEKPLKSLSNHLDDVSVDITHLEDAGKADVPLLKLTFPHPYNRHIESINTLIQNAVDSLNFNLKLTRIYPRMPLFVVRLNSLSIDPQIGYIIDIRVEKNDDSGIIAYALIAGDIITSDTLQIIA